MSTPRFRDLSPVEAASVVDSFLGERPDVDFTEKLAGQHLTATFDPATGWRYTIKSGESSSGGYFPDVEEALEEHHPRTRPVKYTFEVLKKRRRPDYIAYDLKNDVAAEYSGTMTPEAARRLNSAQDSVTFLTRDDIRKPVAGLLVDPKTRNVLKKFSAAAKVGRASRAEKIAIESILMDLVDSEKMSSAAGGPRVEGLFGLVGRQGFKIPSKKYADVQLLQAKFYALARRLGAHGVAARFDAAGGDPNADQVVKDVIDYVDYMASDGPGPGFKVFFGPAEATKLKALADSYLSGVLAAGRKLANIFMNRVSDRSSWVASGLSEGLRYSAKNRVVVRQGQYGDFSDSGVGDKVKLTEKLLKRIVAEESERLDEERFRQRVRRELSILREEKAVSVGKQITGTSKSEKAVSYIEKNPALSKAIDSLRTSSDLAAFMQGVISLATRENIDQEELKSALNKVVSGVKSAKSEKES